jgi:hypothetical protein
MFALGKEEFHVDFSSMFGQYKRAMVFDTGVISIDEDKVRQFSELTHLPVERRRITLDHFIGLIRCI